MRKQGEYLLGFLFWFLNTCAIGFWSHHSLCSVERALGVHVDGSLLRGPSISEPRELGSCGRLYVRPISSESDAQPGLPFIAGSVHNVYGQNFQAQPSGRRCRVWWPSDSVPTPCRYRHLIGFIKPLPWAYKIMIRTSFTEGWVLSEKKGGLLTSMSAELQPQVE